MRDPISYLPASLRDAAAKLPPEKAHTVLELKDAGEGHNASLISVAATCYRMGVSFDDTLSHLRDIYSRDRVDYRTAPRRAVTRVWEGEGEVPTEDDDGFSGEVNPQEEMLLRFKRTSVNEIVELSPGDVMTGPKTIISHLFSEEQIINVQRTQFEAGTLLRVKDVPKTEDFHEFKFLNPSVFKKIGGVPNPLDADKKIATRCNANVASRPYMVLEMDSEDETQVERFNTFALELSNFVPLKMAVDTGGKSIHWWFVVGETPAATVASVFALARMHGADKQLAVKSQIARMPNVSVAKDDRTSQRVLYWNPDLDGAPEKWDLKGFEDFLHQAKQLEYYYHGNKGRYWMQDNTTSWTPINRTSMAVHLSRQGFRNKKAETELVSPVEEIMADVEMNKSIDEALKGASGKHAGYYEENGFRVLVTKSPKLLKPRKGEWQMIQSYLKWLLSEDPIQYDVFISWLARAVRQFRNNNKRQSLYAPAQMLHFIGPANSGKTILVRLLPLLFGGRSTKADKLFNPKGSDFNADLFASEILFLDDTKVLGTDYTSRTYYGETCKEVTVSAGGSYHGKHVDQVSVTPWWRIVRMMNQEPSTLATLPPLENGVEDKLIYFRTKALDGGPVDMTGKDWFNKFWGQVQTEIPALLHYLLDEHVMPDSVADPEHRYGVMSYKNRWILEQTAADSPESYLLHKLRTDAKVAVFTGTDDVWQDAWEGTSNQLYEAISEAGSPNAQRRFQKICPSPRVLTGLLKNLEMDRPDLVQYSGRSDLGKRKIDGNLFWKVHLPPESVVNDTTENEITINDCI